MSDTATNPHLPPRTFATYSGTLVTADTAIGLPAVLACIRLIAGMVAQLPLNVWKGQNADRKLADNTWQYELLHERPFADEMSPFDWVSDMASSIEAAGNFFAQKIRGIVRRNQILALRPLHPQHVYAERDKDTNEKLFRVWNGRQWARHSRSEILHVRGLTVGTSIMGLSPIAVHRQKLGSAIALDEYEGRFFSNDATPPGAIVVPGRVTETQAQEIERAWMSKHAGVENQHRPAILHSGADWKTIGVSHEDAQFVETQRMSVETIARMFGVPPALLGIGGETERSQEQEALRFLVFNLQQRLSRIESSLNSDVDLFPERDPYPEFDTRNLIRTDAATLAEVMHKQLQVGLKLIDEGRAELGLPPLPDGAGKIPQIVPVGGSPAGVPLPSGDDEED